MRPSEVLPPDAGLPESPPFDVLARARRYPHVFPVVVLSIVVVALWLPRMAGPLDLRWDGAVYYVLGSSLAEGKGYRLLNEPGDIEACQYPPALPLLAAVPQVVLGTSDPVVVGRWLKVVFFCFDGALAIATYFLLGTFVPGWLAFLGTLALLLNVQATFHSNLFFTEIPYALVTVLFVLSRRRGSSRVQEAVAAALGVTAFLLRTAGIALLAAWVAEALLQRQFRRAAGRLLIAAIPILGWNVYVLHVERSASYANPAYPYQRAPYLNYNVSYATNISLDNAYSPGFRRATAWQLLSRLWHNALGVPIALGEGVSDTRDYWKQRLAWRFARLGSIRRWAFYVPLVLLGGPILGGIVVLIGRRDFFTPAYIATALMLMCATPWPQQFRRYLTALLPFLLVALFVCVLAVGDWLRTFWPRSGRLWAVTGPMVVLALVFDAERHGLADMYRHHVDPVRAEARDGRVVEYRVFYDTPPYASLDDGLRWLKARAKPEDVIATSMPQWAYLVTGLKSVRPPLESAPERVQALLDSVPVAYLVLDVGTVGDFAVPYLLPVVGGDPRAWKPVYNDREGRALIYQRVRPGDEGEGVR